MFRRRVLWYVFGVISFYSAIGCTSIEFETNADSDQELSTVILVSIDGMKPSYIKTAHPPHLKALMRESAVAEGLIPVFPSKTFPNHYAIVTGLYAENHGLVGNTFYDPKLKRTYSLRDRAEVQSSVWYGGEPIWVTAGRQGVRSACFFWPGSEAEIAGRRPDFYKIYDGSVPNSQRVDQVLHWLAMPMAERPRLITLYFSDVDSAGHKFGPDAPQTLGAVLEVDKHIGALVAGIKKSSLKHVQLVIVSDHGMTAVSPKRYVALESKLKGYDIEKLTVASPVAMIWPGSTQAEKLTQVLNHKAVGYKAYVKSELPEHLRFKNHHRIAPVVVVADLGWSLGAKPLQSENLARFSKGAHGYEPQHHDMHGVFIAHGSMIKSPVVLPAFVNVEVYELLARLLGVEPSSHDGRGVLRSLVPRH